MSTIVTYETNLQWMNLIQMSPDTRQVIIEDINLFRPTVPIETIYGNFLFKVLKDGEGAFINVKVDLECSPLCDEGPIEKSYNILDEVVIGRLKDMLFAMNLAYPGHVFIYKSALFRNGELAKIFSYSSDISGMAFRDCNWLSFEKLSISQCWDWLTTKTGFLSYISKTPIDRALHALSYESVANEDQFIFYVMLGIEAIYNDGSNQEDSISAQLKRKAQAIIGPLPPKAIKGMNTMYKMRSGLVHGGLNIYKCWPSENCTEEEYEMADKDREYVVTATGILIATIQQFIKANANTLIENVTISLGSG